MTHTNRDTMINGLPLGKSWGITQHGTRVTIVRRDNGEWAIHAGWRIEEAEGDDPLSLQTPVSKHLPGAHAWTSAYFAAEPAARRAFDAAVLAPATWTPVDALRIENGSTSAQ